ASDVTTNDDRTRAILENEKRIRDEAKQTIDVLTVFDLTLTGFFSGVAMLTTQGAQLLERPVPGDPKQLAQIDEQIIKLRADARALGQDAFTAQDTKNVAAYQIEMKKLALQISETASPETKARLEQLKTATSAAFGAQQAAAMRALTNEEQKFVLEHQKS